MLLGLAWRNIWRQPRRTLLNLGSIAFAALVMVFLLAFQLGSYATMKENVLRVFDGFARVQPAGYSDDPVLRRTLDDPAQLMRRLAGISGISAVAPRASTYAILSR
ncbi:MAG: ABC transporter permease, partial [Gammaproteobacteria bacterium]